LKTTFTILESQMSHPCSALNSGCWCFYLHPVSCCVVRAAELVYTDRLHRGAHTLAWEGGHGGGLVRHLWTCCYPHPCRNRRISCLCTS